MTGPVARFSDVTAHGGQIINGDCSVLVGNEPAARMGDMHLCVLGPPPHVGGPIVQGHALVLVGNLPLATVGCVAACNGPPDLVITGCPTVLAGDDCGGSAGGAAGGDGTAGGEASEGEPETVRFEYRLLDRDMPVRNAQCRMFVDDQELSASSDGDGVIALDIPANASTAYLLVEAEEPQAQGAVEPPQAGDGERPRWTHAGSDFRRPQRAGDDDEQGPEDLLEIPIVLGRLEPLVVAAGPEAKGNLAAAKQRLAQLGFMDHGAPEHFGAAVRDFQLYKGLPATGLLDAATCQALDSFEAQHDAAEGEAP